jgi:small GTP-binding protein
MSDSDYINYQKLLIFGSEKVGKTTLITALKSSQSNNIDISSSSQDQISFEKSYIKINENTFNFTIYEIKITEKNDSQSTNLNTLLLDCQGIIYLIDNTVNSFECMKNLINLLNFTEKTYTKQILIKNKSDLIYNENISNETITNFLSTKTNIHFIEVSLQYKTNFNQIQNFIIDSFSAKNSIPSNNILENSNIANTQKLSVEGNSIKLLLLGDTSVGKSSFINRYFKNFFQEEFLSTIGLDSQNKIIKIFNDKYKLTIWDTAGQERFRSITRNYYKNADGVFLIYDVNDSENYDNISKWVNDIKENNTAIDNKITIYLLGNKIDLNQRKIDYVRAEEMAKNLGIKYFEISCKLNININEVVDRMVLEVYQKSNNPKGQSLESNKKKENSGCCGGNKKKK